VGCQTQTLTSRIEIYQRVQIVIIIYITSVNFYYYLQQQKLNVGCQTHPLTSRKEIYQRVLNNLIEREEKKN
jgi:hypothetical protein